MTTAEPIAAPKDRARLELPPCDYQPREYDGPSRDEVLALRKSHLNPAIFAYYRDPLMLVEGHRQYLFDDAGRRYLDFFAGIVTVACGHGHPHIVDAIRRQIATLGHTTTVYLHPNIATLAQRLTAKLPDGLDTVYFCNSGSEANDLAVLMARLYTGNQDLLCLRNGYHGGSSSTMGFTSHSSWKQSAQLGGPVHHAILPDPYRCPFEGPIEDVVDRCVDDVQDVIRYSTPGSVAAFLAEPIQGVGGVTVLPEGYLPKVYDVVRAAGGLCISDEVQTGFGRTGENFWGFENSGVVPDIVTMAKAIGNGLPLAAVVTRREIAETLAAKLHINTFGGNPVSMAAGNAVLDVFEAEDLQGNCGRLGPLLRRGLDELGARHSIVGDVRGQGLMQGIELVEDRAEKTPATAATAEVLEVCREHGLLVGKGGLFGNALRMTPPLCVTEQDIEFALEALDDALRRVSAG